MARRGGFADPYVPTPEFLPDEPDGALDGPRRTPWRSWRR